MPQVRIKQYFSGSSAGKSENVNFVILSAAHLYGLLSFTVAVAFSSARMGCSW